MEDDFDCTDVWRPDVLCQRTEALRYLAAQVDTTEDKKARELLIRAMERVVERLTDPRDNVKEIND